MNNLLNYNDYLKKAYDYAEEVNEGTGIRGFANKVAQGKIKAELAEEIEMSKSIMEGISEGLDSLNDNFDAIKKDIKSKKKDSMKGENQKKLDEISKIIEDSKKQTWDLNELIDEGEIDYAGFTANVGLATATYFGVLLFPVRASVIVHKGYNYFFNLVKNTIRKSLVMLQLNYDQFENLIIYQSFVSADYIRDMDMASETSAFYEKMVNALFNEKTGTMKNARGHQKMADQLKAFKDKFDAEMKMNKNRRESNPYTMLDQYNNTYTKSLETLRTYSQEDVQKQLDAIKNSMNKLAGGDVDLQAYGELIIAMAEEHAYKVSTSIYNRFAKMTEVFSLPNQKKMIDLIQAASIENEKNAKAAYEKKVKSDKYKAEVEEAKTLEEGGKKIFTETEGVKATLGEMKEGSNKYDSADGKEWTYDKYNELSDDDKAKLGSWLEAHPEVLKTCDDTLQVAIPTGEAGTGGFFDYADSLVDDISSSLVAKEVKKEEDEDDETDESKSFILNFDDFSINESMKKTTKEKLDKIIDDKDVTNILELVGKVVKVDSDNHTINIDTEKSYSKLIKLLDRLKERAKDDKDSRSDDVKTWAEELEHTLADIRKGLDEARQKRNEKKAKKAEDEKKSKSEEKPEEKKEESKEEEKPADIPVKVGDDEMTVSVAPEIIRETTFYLDLNKCEDQKREIKEMYVDKPESAKLAYKLIGEKIIKDNKFSKISDNFIDKIIDSYNDGDLKRIKISDSTFNKLKDSINELKDARKNDYVSYYNGESEDKKEKSEK